MEFIPISAPHLTLLEEGYLVDAYKSGWVSSSGPYVEKLESILPTFTGTNFATPVSNGTTALHLALLALDINAGDEVIIPNLSYVAVANAVIYCGAIPILCDVTESNLAIDANEVLKKISPKTKAIIVVHNYGFFTDVLEIKKLVKPFGIKIIEDCAEAPFLSVNGITTGTQGDIATYSFFGNKVVTSGEGGCVASNDIDLIKKVNYLKNQANIPENRFVFEDLGYNYRMTNLQAAVLVGQLERFEELISSRYRVFETYQKYLKNNKKIRLVTSDPISNMSPWLFSIRVNQGDVQNIMTYLHRKGIDTRPFFSPHSLAKRFRTPAAYPISEALNNECFNLPTFPKLSDDKIEYICSQINHYFNTSS